MRKIHMIPWEMAELLQLLKRYSRIYYPDNDSYINATIKEIENRIAEEPGNAYTVNNPRGAGRHATIIPNQKTEIIKLHNEGKSIRKIAAETGLSIGSVHKLINEHPR